jgi:hypothetical protein
MAHYAQLNENNIVIDVHCINDIDERETEQETNDWLVSLFGGSYWRKTSWNTRGDVHLQGGSPYRKNYAIIDGSYDNIRDAFINPQPFPSWTLNEDTCAWQPPHPYPGDGNLTAYEWIESDYQNDNTKGWIVLPTHFN